MHWHPSLITSSCSRALLRKQRWEALTPYPGLHKCERWERIRDWSPSHFSSLPTHSFSRTNGFLVGGPAESRLSRLLPYEVSCLNMSTVIGNSFFILKAETGVWLPSKSQSETNWMHPSHRQLCWDLRQWQGGGRLSLRRWICLTNRDLYLGSRRNTRGK